ncbi:IclR family transcriptional regulator [Olivibacter sp. SDN3]|uniref:IclR family transcriptional regulator n=1 Tax=Olivibacter sp. SDN3 TaxID=2764720 RepID=UPI0016514FEA|nr:IclR family transcriptional regulator [Olivibacter sp. SDN3]QNL52268.1 IclR family transcriptional regulator [Olivibacter sp. SDN3]
MQSRDNKYQAPALEKGLAILEYLSSQSIPQSQTEIAAGIGRSQNEIYRMLISLEHTGYILREEVSGKYRLSLKLYYLSHHHSIVDELRRAALNAMEGLADSIKEACHLSIIYRSKLMVITHVKSPAPIALSIEEGSLFPLILTASGRVLLAYSTNEVKDNLLSNSQSYQTFDKARREELNVLLHDISQRGHYIMQSDLAEGVTDIAVPIIHPNTGIVACLTVSKLTKFNIDINVDNKRILREIEHAVHEILKKIGFA